VVPSTQRELQIAETPEEIRERLRQTDTSKLGSPAPGSAAYMKSSAGQNSSSDGFPSAYQFPATCTRLLIAPPV
jgi:hypothetical protein